MGVRRAGGEGLLLLLLGVREDRTGEELIGSSSGEAGLVPNAI